MSKLGFIASFLAAFITMDEQFFDGATTRAVWYSLVQTSHTAEAQLHQWSRPIGRQ